MDRVLVIGSSGAGKSHFAQRLAEITGLPLVHLDDVYWSPDWTRRHTPEGWVLALSDLVAGDRWILDGNYPESLELRAARADRVVVLQYPRWLCLYRAITRAWLNRRPDRATLGRETLDWEFLTIIWRFPKVGRRELERLKAFAGLTVTVLRNDREALDFLRAIEASRMSERNTVAY